MPTKVKFTTKEGEKVTFPAHKKEKVPVKVKFEAEV